MFRCKGLPSIMYKIWPGTFHDQRYVWTFLFWHKSTSRLRCQVIVHRVPSVVIPQASSKGNYFRAVNIMTQYVCVLLENWSMWWSLHEAKRVMLCLSGGSSKNDRQPALSLKLYETEIAFSVVFSVHSAVLLILQIDVRQMTWLDSASHHEHSHNCWPHQASTHY